MGTSTTDMRPAVDSAGARERVLRGMVDIAARSGYGGASVARVIESAGVSRATFYEHFCNRDDCFLSAYRQVVEKWRARVLESAGDGSGPVCPRTVLRALLEGLAADPPGARLVLIEARAASPAIRAEHERLIAETEAAIGRAAGRCPGDTLTLQISPVALLGGIVGVLSRRCFEGEAISTGDSLLAELSSWVDAYRLPPGQYRHFGDEYRFRREPRCASVSSDPPADSSGPLPRGRGALSPARAARARRSRLLIATARVVASKGYRATTVADIAAVASVTRAAFYSHFRSKEDVFLETQRVALEGTTSAAAAGFFLASSWPERIWKTGWGALEYMERNPDHAYLEIVEPSAVGRIAIRRDYDARLAYSLFLEEGYQIASDTTSLPRLYSEAIASAIFALMHRQVLRGRATRMLEILPQCTYVSVAPFIGPVQAMKFVESQARGAC